MDDPELKAWEILRDAFSENRLLQIPYTGTFEGVMHFRGLRYAVCGICEGILVLYSIGFIDFKQSGNMKNMIHSANPAGSVSFSKRQRRNETTISVLPRCYSENASRKGSKMKQLRTWFFFGGKRYDVSIYYTCKKSKYNLVMI